MKLLHIDSSILGQQSVSRQLTAQLIEAARQQHGDVSVTYRDLDRRLRLVEAHFPELGV